MAKNVSKSSRKASPSLTRNGRTRLKPLNLTQLNDLIAKSSRPRDKSKIDRRIKVLQSRSK